MGTKDKRPGKASIASRLIDEAKRKAQRVQPLTQLGVEHLQELCDYNDTLSGQVGRVSQTAAAESLAVFGWKGSRVALDRVCREQLGRESFARKGGSK